MKYEDQIEEDDSVKRNRPLVLSQFTSVQARQDAVNTNKAFTQMRAELPRTVCLGSSSKQARRFDRERNILTKRENDLIC